LALKVTFRIEGRLKRKSKSARGSYGGIYSKPKFARNYDILKTKEPELQREKKKEKWEKKQRRINRGDKHDGKSQDKVAFSHSKTTTSDKKKTVVLSSSYSEELPRRKKKR